MNSNGKSRYEPMADDDLRNIPDDELAEYCRNLILDYQHELGLQEMTATHSELQAKRQYIEVVEIELAKRGIWVR